MTEQYVTFKLITGEHLIGEITNQNDYSITILNPFIVSNKVAVDLRGRMIEQLSAVPWCTYALDPMFTFELKHIMFVKPLKQKVIDSYMDMVHQQNLKEMVHDDVEEYADMVNELLAKLGYEPPEDNPEASDEDVYDNSINYLEGNDTIH